MNIEWTPTLIITERKNSASNVLKMLLDITVSIGCAVVVFHSYRQTKQEAQIRLLTFSGKIERQY